MGAGAVLTIIMGSVLLVLNLMDKQGKVTAQRLRQPREGPRCIDASFLPPRSGQEIPPPDTKDNC
jgi:hypothetical protein